VAPEFFPILAFIGLAFVALVAFPIGVAFAIAARDSSKVPSLLAAFSAMAFSAGAVAVIVLFVLGTRIRQQYFLNEPLVSACSEGDLAQAQWLLARGASADAYGVDFAETALIAACRSGHREIVSLLLRSGANAGLQDTQGKTALQRAREAGHDDVVLLLGGVVESQ